jgi:hypothetical protein
MMRYACHNRRDNPIPETIPALTPALLLPYRGTRICRHTTPSVSPKHKTTRPPSRRPHHYNSGGIYAFAYNGVPSALTPSALQRRDAATPVTVTLKAEDFDKHTRRCRPRASEIHPEPTTTAPLPHDTAMTTSLKGISLELRGLILPKPTSSRFWQHFSGQTQLTTSPTAPLLSPPATRSRRQGPPRRRISSHFQRHLRRHTSQLANHVRLGG